MPSLGGEGKPGRDGQTDNNWDGYKKLLQQRKQQQNLILEHTAWANSILKQKKCKVVVDLRKSIGDGVTLVNLVEILANEKLEGVVSQPLARSTKIDNLQKCLSYLDRQQVDTKTLSAQDLVDGNLKSTLTLMNGLRKHFDSHYVSRELADGAVSSGRPPSRGPIEKEPLVNGDGKYHGMNGVSSPRSAPILPSQSNLLPGSLGDDPGPGPPQATLVNTGSGHWNKAFEGSTTELDKNTASQKGVEERRFFMHNNPLTRSSPAPLRPRSGRVEAVELPPLRTNTQAWTKTRPQSAQGSSSVREAVSQTVQQSLKSALQSPRSARTVTRTPEDDLLRPPPPSNLSHQPVPLGRGLDNPGFDSREYSPSRFPTSKSPSDDLEFADLWQSAYVPSRPEEKFSGSRGQSMPDRQAGRTQHMPQSAIPQQSPLPAPRYQPPPQYTPRNNRPSGVVSQPPASMTQGPGGHKQGQGGDLRSACSRLYQREPSPGQLKQGANLERSPPSYPGPRDAYNRVPPLYPGAGVTQGATHGLVRSSPQGQSSSSPPSHNSSQGSTGFMNDHSNSAQRSEQFYSPVPNRKGNTTFSLMPQSSGPHTTASGKPPLAPTSGKGAPQVPAYGPPQQPNEPPQRPDRPVTMKLASNAHVQTNVNNRETPPLPPYNRNINMSGNTSDMRPKSPAEGLRDWSNRNGAMNTGSSSDLRPKSPAVGLRDWSNRNGHSSETTSGVSSNPNSGGELPGQVRPASRLGLPVNSGDSNKSDSFDQEFNHMHEALGRLGTQDRSPSRERLQTYQMAPLKSHTDQSGSVAINGSRSNSKERPAPASIAESKFIDVSQTAANTEASGRRSSSPERRSPFNDNMHSKNAPQLIPVPKFSSAKEEWRDSMGRDDFNDFDSDTSGTGSVTPPLPPLSPDNTPPFTPPDSPVSGRRGADFKYGASLGDDTPDVVTSTARKAALPSGARKRHTKRVTGSRSKRSTPGRAPHHRSAPALRPSRAFDDDLETPDDSFSDQDGCLSADLDQEDGGGKGELHMMKQKMEGLEVMYQEVLRQVGMDRDYLPGSRRSISSVSSVNGRRSRFRQQNGPRSKDMKQVNKRFSRLESHVVTLARSVAHLSSEMRSQSLLHDEVQEVKKCIKELKEDRLKRRGVGGGEQLNEWERFRGWVPSLTNPKRVNKLTRFFGQEPPLLHIFLKKLGYEKYIQNFEKEKIGMIELPYMTEERLQKIGLPMGPRLRILQEAQMCFRQENFNIYIV